MFISPILNEDLRRWCRWSAIAEISRAAIALHDAMVMHRGDEVEPSLRLTILNAGVIQTEDIIRLGHHANIQSLHIDAPALSAQALVVLLSLLPRLREVVIERLDWTTPGDLPEGLAWTFHEPSESMIDSLPATSQAITLRRGSLTKRLCLGLKAHQTRSLCLEHCDAHGDTWPWNAETLQEVALHGIPAMLVDRAIADQLNITSLGEVKGALNLKRHAARAVLQGIQHLEVQHGDHIFEALQHSDEPFPTLQTLKIAAQGGTDAAALACVLGYATQLRALALHAVSPDSREVKGIPWSRLNALSLRNSTINRLNLSEQGAPFLELLDVSDTPLRSVLDLTPSTPRLCALFASGVKQLVSTAECLPHAKLRLLDLSCSNLTEDAARALFHDASFPSLRALNMEQLYQSAVSPSDIAVWCGARSLMQVNLYEFAGTSENLQEALQKNAQTLQILTLGNGTNCVGGIDAAEAKPFRTLTHLQFLYAPCQMELRRLLQALRATPLQHLSIMLKNDAALEILLDAPLLSQLHSLSISGAITNRSDLDPNFILALLIDAGASPLLTLGWDYEVDP